MRAMPSHGQLRGGPLDKQQGSLASPAASQLARWPAQAFQKETTLFPGGRVERVQGRAMGVTTAISVDAYDVGDLPGLIRAPRAGVASRPMPQTASSLDEGGSSSSQLPYFINSSASSSEFPPDPHSSPRLDQDTCPSPDGHHPPDTDLLQLSYTFYFSPSASRFSGASSTRSSFSYLCYNDQEDERTMPGATFDAPDEPQFLVSTMADYFSSSSTAPSVNAELRPSSTGSARSERTASPLSFARWARRHQQQQQQQQHHDPHVAGHGQPQMEHQAHKMKRRDGGSTGASPGSRSGLRRPGRSRSASTHRRHPLHAGAGSQMTRQEFEALPVTIQRKYFSTLERLRFAQESGLVDGISQHYDDISSFRRQKPGQDGSAPEHPVGRRRRGSVLEFQSPPSDSSPVYAGLSEATHQQAASCLDRRRIALAGRRRVSVILDATDEAVYKLNQKSSRRNLSTTTASLTPPLSPSRNSMDSHDGPKLDGQHGEGYVPQSFYDSFRWLEEEEDLDLRLFLDDYHAHLREGTPTTKQRPSFRRHLSVFKLPFGRRTSVSVAASSRPGTRDATTPPALPIHGPTTAAASVSNGLTGHARRRSRALSLIAPRHVPQPSVTAFDPAAAHYQDPEARLKLRVYLASPQKFDEAVEFGFPSADALASAAPAAAAGQSGQGASWLGRSQSKRKQHARGASSHLRTFLDDDDEEDDDGFDNLSLDGSDQPSLADPDSPRTPEPLLELTTPTAINTTPTTTTPVAVNGGSGVQPRHTRLLSSGAHSILGGGGGSGAGRRTPDLYAQAPASSREMTLRMTLTRPDLRAHEDEIYGWQMQPQVQPVQQQPQLLRKRGFYQQQQQGRRTPSVHAQAARPSTSTRWL